jgi:sterol desaturase/sphingolipid hydroxylase (fatty acid hydroxylase superfamily)
VNLVLAFLVVDAGEYVSLHHVGLLYLVSMPAWLFMLAGLLLLDLIGAWFIHWLQHRIKWMWKFHIIHHADTWVDVTTANRHHPGESIFRFVFTLLAVIITGAPMWLIYLYQALSVLVSQFSHANISLPPSVDRFLSWFIISPNMHKVHHHYKQPLTDTNYGNIFSFWDRLFGTFVEVKDVHTIQYGIDSYPKEEENNNPVKLIKIPFEAYRPPPGGKFEESE